MNQKIDRRSFLRGAIALAAFAGTSAVVTTRAHAARCPKLPKPKRDKTRVAFRLDSELGQTFSGVLDLTSVDHTSGAGVADRLSVDLLLDGLKTETAVDVMADQIAMLTVVNGELHRPETALLTWGKGFSFTCTIEQAHVAHTAFLADGTPVRATVNVTLRREQLCELPAVR